MCTRFPMHLALLLAIPPQRASTTSSSQPAGSSGRGMSWLPSICGMSGLAKMFSSFHQRPPAFSANRPLGLRTQPPFHLSWSSQALGYPMPGLDSTLLNQAYSTPSRDVHTFLQVTEQVWHPMHLSRFSTIAI